MTFSLFLCLFPQFPAFLYKNRHFYSLISSAFQDGDTLPGKYCSFAQSIQQPPNKSVILTSRGLNIPIKISECSNEKISHFCIACFNLSDQGRAVWLYLNVNRQIAKKQSNYREGNFYNDYGKDVLAIQTDWQKQNQLSEGYFGPINKKGIFNKLLQKQSLYEIRVFQLKAPSEAKDQSNALRDCGTAVAALRFVSKFSQIILVGLVVLAFMLL